MTDQEYFEKLFNQFGEFQKETGAELKRISKESTETNLLLKTLKEGIFDRISNIEKTGLQRYETATERIRGVEQRFDKELLEVKTKNAEQDRERIEMIKGALKWGVTMIGTLVVTVIAGFVTLHLKR